MLHKLQALCSQVDSKEHQAASVNYFLELNTYRAPLFIILWDMMAKRLP